MTRPEYKEAIKERWPSYTRLENRNFALLLMDIAAELFFVQDITSPLAKETIRRLKQLNETGVTDP